MEGRQGSGSNRHVYVVTVHIEVDHDEVEAEYGVSGEETSAHIRRDLVNSVRSALGEPRWLGIDANVILAGAKLSPVPVED